MYYYGNYALVMHDAIDLSGGGVLFDGGTRRSRSDTSH